MALETNGSPLISHHHPKSPIAEAFRMLRTNLHYADIDRKIRKIMVTSAGPGEGKSHIISNLGVTLAQAGQKVLIIDADLRRPDQHKIFQLKKEWGLTRLLQQDLPLKQAVQRFAGTGLEVLTSGPIPPNPSEMLGSQRMRDFMDSIEGYDLVLVDTPPVLVVTDAQIIADLVDGVILVIDSGQVTIPLAQKGKETLEKARAQILGVVLNNIKPSAEDYYYYYYYGEDRP